MSARPGLAAILAAGCALALAFAACGPPKIAPVSAAAAETTCPGGATAWALEILDRRADREGSEQTVALLKDSIVKSFPSCSWREPGAPGLPSLLIEINRFAAPYQEGMWEGAAEWSVLARNAAGQTLTDFEAISESSQPNYQGVNNEKQVLGRVFGEAFAKTVAGLRAVPPLK